MSFSKLTNYRLILCLLLGILLLNMTSCSKYQDYRENQRRDNFNKNFEVFQKLEKMQREDIRRVGHVSINRDFGNLSKARLNEYRELMKQAGLEYFGYVSEEPKKRMVRFYQDIDIVDSGYVYMEYPPPNFLISVLNVSPLCRVSLAISY